MQAGLWTGAASALALAIASGIAEWRRRRRAQIDRVGVVPWPTVQFLGLMVALLLVSVALNS